MRDAKNKCTSREETECELDGKLLFFPKLNTIQFSGCAMKVQKRKILMGKKIRY